jgi:hypothetical protein
MIASVIKSKFLQYKIYIIIAALAALVAGEFFAVRSHYVTQCEVKIKTINEKNLKDQNTNLEKIRIIEKDLANTKDELERTNVERKKKIADLHAYYADYIAKHGLRDPGRKTNPTAPAVPGSSGAASDNAGSCEDQRLSDQAGGFLLELTREADEVKADYQTCYEWAEKVRKALKPEN